MLQLKNNVTELLNVYYNFINTIDIAEKDDKIIT